MNVIDLFSGGGGLTEGFTREGFKIIAHIEKEKWACETLKTRMCYHYLKEKDDLENYKKYINSCKDYKKVEENRKIIYDKYPEIKEKIDYEVLNLTFGNPEQDKNATGIKEIIGLIEKSMKFNNVNNIDLIIGGPPCQAYSLVGRGVMKSKVEDDNRNYLFRYYKEIVNHFKPKMFVFENVPGIITAKKGAILNAINEEFDEIGYTLLSGENEEFRKNIVEAEKLNIPQRRKRVILFGFRKELNYSYPDIFRHKYKFNSITTRDAIGDLPARKSGQGSYGEILKYKIKAEDRLSDFQKEMRCEYIGVTLHQTRKHNERDLLNYQDVIRAAQEGRRIVYTDFPEERRTHKNEKSFVDRYKVHWWEETPHTILAHLGKDGHYNIHPDIKQLRSISVREAARIQTFPDDYYFEGPRIAQFTQIGNAVPPLMAQAIAKGIKELEK